MIDMFGGVVLCAVMAFVLLLGFSMGKESATSDCKDFGSFTSKTIIYDCKPRAGSN